MQCIIVPPRTVQLVEAKTSSEIADDPAMMIRPSVMTSTDILVPWGISPVVDNKVKAALINVTDKKITLTKGATVAELEVPNTVQIVHTVHQPETTSGR